MTKLWLKERKKQYDVENEGYKGKRVFLGFMDDVPSRKKSKIYVIKKRFVHPVEIVPEMIELISAGTVVIHTADAYYVVSITGANEPPTIFFSCSQPKIGKELVGDEILYSNGEMDIKHLETVTEKVIDILNVVDIDICYTMKKVYLVAPF